MFSALWSETRWLERRAKLSGSPTECTTATTVYPCSTVRLCAQQESRGREGTRLELCNRSFFLSCCCCARSFRSKIMGLQERYGGESIGEWEAKSSSKPLRRRKKNSRTRMKCVRQISHYCRLRSIWEEKDICVISLAANQSVLRHIFATSSSNSSPGGKREGTFVSSLPKLKSCSSLRHAVEGAASLASLSLPFVRAKEGPQRRRRRRPKTGSPGE